MTRLSPRRNSCRVGCSNVSHHLPHQNNMEEACILFPFNAIHRVLIRVASDRVPNVTLYALQPANESMNDERKTPTTPTKRGTQKPNQSKKLAWPARQKRAKKAKGKRAHKNVEKGGGQKTELTSQTKKTYFLRSLPVKTTVSQGGKDTKLHKARQAKHTRRDGWLSSTNPQQK